LAGCTGAWSSSAGAMYTYIYVCIYMYTCVHRYMYGDAISALRMIFTETQSERSHLTLYTALFDELEDSFDTPHGSFDKLLVRCSLSIWGFIQSSLFRGQPSVGRSF